MSSSSGNRKVGVNQKAAKRLESGHPWIFTSDVLDTNGAAPGEAVTVTGPRGQILGTAHYSSSSQIALRLLSPHAVPIDLDFFRSRIEAARRHRELVVQDSNAFRLIHSEGDFLPGLIVDSYDGHLAAQFLDQGMDAATPLIVQALIDVCNPTAIAARNDAAVRRLESLPLEKKVLHGQLSGPVPITMNGLRFEADLIEGQKTGVYLDQRENYLAASRYVRPQSRVLDCFTSTGGFALHLARAGAQVDAADSSAPALATAKRNAAANGLEDRIRWNEADVPRLLRALATSRQKYAIVVLDPPAFAKSRGSVADALRGYRDLHYRALQLLEPGGILVTCSCSHHVSEDMLIEVAKEAAQALGTSTRVLERRFQSRDHSVLITVPETLYLKCLILQVLTRSTDIVLGEMTNHGTVKSPTGAGPRAGSDSSAALPSRAEPPVTPDAGSSE
jgi:23S rRNA (cytosine1962-C5)-methyltransferase